MAAFRHRGIRVFVDTTQTAEFDIKGFQLGEEFLNTVSRMFEQVPMSPQDVTYGQLRSRVVGGYVFYFIVARDADAFVVTLFHVQVFKDETTTERMMKLLETLAKARGLLGI